MHTVYIHTCTHIWTYREGRRRCQPVYAYKNTHIYTYTYTHTHHFSPGVAGASLEQGEARVGKVLKVLGAALPEKLHADDRVPVCVRAGERECVRVSECE